MIYLEDYDIPVIALNVNMFMTALLFIFTDMFSKIIEYLAVGEGEVFGFGAALISVLAVLLFGLTIAATGLVDIWWITKKSRDNRRWL